MEHVSLTTLLIDNEKSLREDFAKDILNEEISPFFKALMLPTKVRFLECIRSHFSNPPFVLLVFQVKNCRYQEESNYIHLLRNYLN